MICANCNTVIYKDTLGDWVDITQGDGCLQDTPETETHIPDYPASTGKDYRLGLIMTNEKWMLEPDLEHLDIWKKQIIKEFKDYVNQTPIDEMRWSLDAEDQ